MRINFRNFYKYSTKGLFIKLFSYVSYQVAISPFDTLPESFLNIDLRDDFLLVVCTFLYIIDAFQKCSRSLTNLQVLVFFCHIINPFYLSMLLI